jgi:hypothetical protein
MAVFVLMLMLVSVSHTHTHTHSQTPAEPTTTAVAASTTAPAPTEAKESTQIGRRDTKRDSSGMPKVSKVIDARVGVLCDAARAGNFDQVKTLIDNEATLDRLEYVNLFDADGRTALFHALVVTTVDDLTPERIKTAHLLMQYGSDPNHQDDKRMTVLHFMCLLNYKPIIPKLIYYGASTTIENW